MDWHVSSVEEVQVLGSIFYWSLISQLKPLKILRNVFMLEVFCRQTGARFQSVDSLRWLMFYDTITFIIYNKSYFHSRTNSVFNGTCIWEWLRIQTFLNVLQGCECDSGIGFWRTSLPWVLHYARRSRSHLLRMVSSVCTYLILWIANTGHKQ